MQELEFPDEGELVIATVDRITPHGVYVRLDEFASVPGFVHISEVATGWVRNIERFMKLKEKTVLKVIRVSRTRREVDLSLRQVTGENRKEKLIQVKRTQKAKAIMENLAARLNVPRSALAHYVPPVEKKFGSLYDGFEALVRKGSSAFEGLEINPDHLAVLESLAKEQISIPKVEVRGLIHITVPSPSGIEIIREALSKAEVTKNPDTEVKVAYVGSPRYRVTVKAENYKVAERALESALKDARMGIEKAKGTFSFEREEVKKRAR